MSGVLVPGALVGGIAVGFVVSVEVGGIAFVESTLPGAAGLLRARARSVAVPVAGTFVFASTPVAVSPTMPVPVGLMPIGACGLTAPVVPPVTAPPPAPAAEPPAAVPPAA
ncbi:MAG: hypothetical protein ACXVCV_15975, partial [Polyangia bacterium]